MANENEIVQCNNNNNNNIGDAKSHNVPPISGDLTQAEHQEIAATVSTEEATCSRGKLNDLVADLCLNGGTAARSAGAFGDCTNIRAYLGKDEDSYAGTQDLLLDNHCAASIQQSNYIQPPQQNSSFSFKHFLNSSNAMTLPSTTVTSLDPVILSSASASSSSSNTASQYGGSTTATATTIPMQTSTGARPKVPQSASVSATSIASLSGLTASGTQEALAAATKMKRSPRFSSFDSQASLAEFAGAESCMEDIAMGGNLSGFRLYNDAGERSDFFSGNSQFVPRSYSNYDMPVPPTSPRRRITTSKEARPTRLALNTSTSKFKLDLPIDKASNANLNVASGASTRLSHSNASDFPPSAAAAALPDFVQDHWMDSWYAHEMHLNSPPNSPICDFAERLPDTLNTTSSSIDVCMNNSNADFISGAGGIPAELPVGSSQMLPDFLSDGPIIHSSQRLADVAAGLPNSMGSPEDSLITSEVTLLRLENERLQCELIEARAALNDQTRRTSEMERQLHERQCSENNRAKSQNISLEEESFDKSKQRSAVPHAHVTKLKQQVTQLTTEVEKLRRENDVLREEGAVGGCSIPSGDRPYVATAAGARGNSGRPSRTQQISRDLLRAASTAENNLRQLLNGVDNLRQMAADIENSESRLDNDSSPDIFSDFLDVCDDEYPGGPAL